MRDLAEMMAGQGSAERPVSRPGYRGLSWVSASELEWLVERLPEFGLFVEVGSSSGVSAAVIADARPRMRVLCLDPFFDADLPEIVKIEGRRVENWLANRRPNMNLFVGTLAELYDLGFGILYADAILIDGDHAEPGVAGDLSLAELMLDVEGTIYVHDCDEPGWPGVTAAVERFLCVRPFEVLGQHWTMRALGRKVRK